MEINTGYRVKVYYRGPFKLCIIVYIYVRWCILKLQNVIFMKEFHNVFEYNDSSSHKEINILCDVKIYLF